MGYFQGPLLSSVTILKLLPPKRFLGFALDKLFVSTSELLISPSIYPSLNRWFFSTPSILLSRNPFVRFRLSRYSPNLLDTHHRNNRFSHMLVFLHLYPKTIILLIGLSTSWQYRNVKHRLYPPCETRCGYSKSSVTYP